MFHITKQAVGNRGSFVKLVQLDSDDYAVIIRSPVDGRLHHRYLGPDLSKAEEVFNTEVGKLPATKSPRQSGTMTEPRPEERSTISDNS